MPSKKNPLSLNPLQLKTLTLLQEVGRLPEFVQPAPEGEGGVLITSLPHAHGDHFHLGDAVIMAKDATGLNNPAAMLALERKGLIHVLQGTGILLTEAGRAYDTGMSDKILHRHHHH